jgi:hypothetical protein
MDADDDLGGAQDLIAVGVAGAHYLDDRMVRDAWVVDGLNGLFVARIEFLAHGVDCLDALALQDLVELVLGELDAFQYPLTVLRGATVLDGALEVVLDAEQLAQQLFLGGVEGSP